MRRGAIAVAVLTLASCAGSRAVAPPAQPATLPLAPHGFVLLQPTGTLFVAPDAGAEHSQYFSSLARALEVADDPFPVFRFVAIDRDAQWVTVETSWSDERHCSRGVSALSELALQLFVRVSDLALVTTRRVRITYPDDTAVELTAGVPLLRGPTRIDAYPDRFAFPAPLPEGAFGLTYEPSPHFLLEDPIAWLDDVQHPGVRFAAVRRPRMPLPRIDEDPLDVYARQPHGDDEVVTLRTDCAQYEVVVAAAAVTHDEPPAYGGFGILGGGGSVPLRIRERAPVFSRRGDRLGTTRVVATVWRSDEVGGAGDHRCFHYAVSGDEAVPGLDLCFASADVRED